MKTVTVSDKVFDKIILLFRSEVKALQQQARECQYILKKWNDDPTCQYGKSYYEGIIENCNKKVIENEKTIKQLTE